MSAKKKAYQSTETKEVKPSSDPLIKTVSEVFAMSDKEKEAFRVSGGTTISDPQ